jgi:hypothetical protein
MNDEVTYKLIDESVGVLLKDILSKHYNSFEKINNNETRIIIDTYIIYIDIKNNLNLIIDRLVDKFKITNRDNIFKLMVNHMYNDETKENIMRVNKIIKSSNLKLNEQYKNLHINHVYEEIFKIIFSDQIIDFIKYYSDPLLIYVYYLKNCLRNWKLMLFITFLIIIFYFSIKKLRTCNI